MKCIDDSKSPRSLSRSWAINACGQAEQQILPSYLLDTESRKRAPVAVVLLTPVAKGKKKLKGSNPYPPKPPAVKGACLFSTFVAFAGLRCSRCFRRRTCASSTYPLRAGVHHTLRLWVRLWVRRGPCRVDPDLLDRGLVGRRVQSLCHGIRRSHEVLPAPCCFR